MKWIIIATVLLSPTLGHAQSQYVISLEKAQPSLAVPTMTAANGVLYVAYRSFDLLRRSTQLQVLAYDLAAHKELMHRTIPVPKVQGARASEKLALSNDGNALAYVETGSPSLILLLKVKDLSELRRLESLPFHEDDPNPKYESSDHPSAFYGFDNDGYLCFRSSTSGRQHNPRFLRINAEDFKLVSDTTASALKKATWPLLNWNPNTKRFWMELDVKQYQESGEPTGVALPKVMPEQDQGAYGLEGDDLLAFYAMPSKGTVVRYASQQNHSLELPCSPSPYGISNDHRYVGAICVTQQGGLPEAGGGRVLTSEFLLIQSDGPTVLWRHPAITLGAGDRGYFRWASSVIEPSGGKIRVIIPTKSAALLVYEIDATP
ncbi:MAG: hypothetical protein P4L10_13420 [Acidobacteriaceae bacterium]|nr:hypothetical protein [Acidobacteriaceae bacterium]